MTLRWDAPVNNGGAAIDRYEYEINRSGTWISTGGTITRHTVSGLTNGRAYTFRVRAHDGVNPGPASDTSPSVTPMGGDSSPPLDPSNAQWSAELTVGQSSSFLGFDNDLFGVLEPGSFTVGGTTYTVEALFLGSEGLTFILGSDLETGFALILGWPLIPSRRGINKFGVQPLCVGCSGGPGPVLVQ